MISQWHGAVCDQSSVELPPEKEGLIGKGEVDGGLVLGDHWVEPGGLARQVEACEAMVVGPISKGLAPA